MSIIIITSHKVSLLHEITNYGSGESEVNLTTSNLIDVLGNEVLTAPSFSRWDGN